MIINFNSINSITSSSNGTNTQDTNCEVAQHSRIICSITPLLIPTRVELVTMETIQLPIPVHHLCHNVFRYQLPVGAPGMTGEQKRLRSLYQIVYS